MSYGHSTTVLPDGSVMYWHYEREPGIGFATVVIDHIERAVPTAGPIVSYPDSEEGKLDTYIAECDVERERLRRMYEDNGTTE